LDEISVSGQTMIGELKKRQSLEYMIHPENSVARARSEGAARGDGEESRNVVVAALENKPERA